MSALSITGIYHGIIFKQNTWKIKRVVPEGVANHKCKEQEEAGTWIRQVLRDSDRRVSAFICTGYSKSAGKKLAAMPFKSLSLATGRCNF